ncbi:MAG: hypothetical protein R3E83_19350 [Burkholderiaceae bacterium]
MTRTDACSEPVLADPEPEGRATSEAAAREISCTGLPAPNLESVDGCSVPVEFDPPEGAIVVGGTVGMLGGTVAARACGLPAVAMARVDSAVSDEPLRLRCCLDHALGFVRAAEDGAAVAVELDLGLAVGEFILTCPDLY